jgi:hypothetical protein
MMNPPPGAALGGDTAGAIAAYRHFLTLQAHPEPAAAPRVKQVRAEPARLTPGAGGPR